MTSSLLHFVPQSAVISSRASELGKAHKRSRRTRRLSAYARDSMSELHGDSEAAQNPRAADPAPAADRGSPLEDHIGQLVSHKRRLLDTGHRRWRFRVSRLFQRQALHRPRPASCPNKLRLNFRPSDEFPAHHFGECTADDASVTATAGSLKSWCTRKRPGMPPYK